MRAIPLVVAATTAVVLATALPAHAQHDRTPTLTTKACKKRGVPQGATCATITVPLDRSGTVPGTIDLPVQVLRATGPGPRRGPLVMLAGGPGQAGIPDADTAALFAQLARGYDLVSGGTDNHLILVDLRNKGLTGKDAEDALQRAEITVNKNMVPFDDQSPFVTSGIRLGSPAMTTRGLKEDDFRYIAELIDRVLQNTGDESIQNSVRKEVGELCRRYPLYDLAN